MFALLIATLFAPDPERTLPAVSPFQLEMKTDRLIIASAKQPLAHFVFKDEKILRPYFAHVHAPHGTRLTRNHPPVPGKDATDHDTMHPGIWLAFGDINGHDFWRNKGTIRHERFTAAPEASRDRVTFATESQLIAPDGKRIAKLLNRFTIVQRPTAWLLVWDATFHADERDLVFGDQEEMGFGSRVATELIEKSGGTITSSSGKKSAKDTWGQPAAWCDYSGKTGGLTLMAAKDNFRESWWHNRDYGVFVANPFGRAAMKQGAKSEVTVKRGQSLRLRFGAALHDAPGFDPATEYKHFLELTK